MITRVTILPQPGQTVEERKVGKTGLQADGFDPERESDYACATSCIEKATDLSLRGCIAAAEEHDDDGDDRANPAPPAPGVGGIEFVDDATALIFYGLEECAAARATVTCFVRAGEFLVAVGTDVT